jgi:hypothetical protein
MIYVYFAIGLTAFCIFQFRSRCAIMNSTDYHIMKALAWVSIFIWPLVGVALIFICIIFLIIFLVEYLDKCVDRVIRKK